jgi:hypothetical protein
MIDIKVTGLEEVKGRLDGFSDRRFGAAIATALTRTAKKVSGSWQAQISAKVNAPTPRTQSATGFTGATAATLQSVVFVKDRTSGLSPAAYLSPLERGGARGVKKFEQALISAGAMPAGYVTVPGKAATLDSYGNVSRALIVAVIAQLGSDYSPGYQRVISKSTTKRLATRLRRGLTYVSVLPDQAQTFGVSPGIYEQVNDRRLRAVFLFKRRASYRRQLSLLDSAAVTSEVQSTMRAELARAVADSAARLRGVRK